MKEVATVYLIISIISKIWEVHCFGEERKPYSPAIWTVGLIVNAPIYWLLWKIAFN